MDFLSLSTPCPLSNRLVLDRQYPGVMRRTRQCYNYSKGVNGGGNMYRRGGAKMYHGLGGSLSV